MKPICFNHFYIALLKGLMVLFPACLLMSACKVIKNYPLTYSEAKAAQIKVPQYYIIDNEHVLTKVWSVTKIDFNKDIINCQVNRIPQPQSQEVVQVTSKLDFYKQKNNIYLFAKPELVQELQKSDSISFDYHQLDHISVLEKDFEATAARRVPLLLVYFLGVFTIYAIAALLQNV